MNKVESYSTSSLLDWCHLPNKPNQWKAPLLIARRTPEDKPARFRVRISGSLTVLSQTAIAPWMNGWKWNGSNSNKDNVSSWWGLWNLSARWQMKLEMCPQSWHHRQFGQRFRGPSWAGVSNFVASHPQMMQQQKIAPAHSKNQVTCHMSICAFDWMQARNFTWTKVINTSLPRFPHHCPTTRPFHSKSVSSTAES